MAMVSITKRRDVESDVATKSGTIGIGGTEITAVSFTDSEQNDVTKVGGICVLKPHGMAGRHYKDHS